MKIRKVWFGFSILLIVGICLLLGYGFYASVLNIKEYVRIYEKEVIVKDDKLEKSEVAKIDDLEIEVTDFYIHTRGEDEFVPMQVYVDDEGNETVTKYTRELGIGVTINKQDKILLESTFDYILYDENNNVLTGFVYGEYENCVKVANEFYREKFGADYLEKTGVEYGMFWSSFAHEGKNDDPLYIERIIKHDLEEDYKLADKYYLRIFNIRYRTEEEKDFITHGNDMIEFVIER